jgi:hypothetical protein
LLWDLRFSSAKLDMDVWVLGFGLYDQERAYAFSITDV